ncbi:MAG: FeoB-associated Cys-rich membrane protein [Sphaerochaetaceae bacterium]|jgi:hypothetical protein|nr:FeoB-associated Cys-rich membrane protein [Sphaerochaetaceae bacterium]MDX9938515.1 FeoB-associated Cys-rich membrane protein [Sphaerochaetaceae bacterium]
MANIIVGIIVFGSLGLIIRSMVSSKHKGKSGCHSGCGTCPFACEKKTESR